VYVEILVIPSVEQIKYQKDKQLAKERADYATKTDHAKAKTIQEVTGLRNDNMQLMVTLERVDEKFQQLREENTNFRKDNDTIHEKLKIAQTKANEMETRWIEASEKLQEANTKLERYISSADEWVKASEKDGIPVWKNTFTKDVIPLPVTLDEFNNYQLVRIENGNNIYKNDTGKEISLPESLGDLLVEKPKEETETESANTDTKKKTKKETGMRPNDTIVLNVVNASDHSLTLEELAELAHIDVKSLSKYTSKLVSRKLINEGYEGTKKVFSKKPEKA